MPGAGIENRALEKLNFSDSGMPGILQSKIQHIRLNKMIKTFY